MKASELIDRLKELIEKHGDREVYHGGGDYPGKVEGAAYTTRGTPYVPKDSFQVWGRF